MCFTYVETDYAKNPDYGDKTTTGYCDYLDASHALFCVICAYNAGHRAIQDFTQMTVNDGKIIKVDGKQIGVVFMQNGPRKYMRCSKGMLTRRLPYFILDKGMNQGICDLFSLMCSGRNSDMSAEYCGKDKLFPENKILLLLYPKRYASVGKSN